ncbi:chromaffin granule amine transporter-like [Clavelina lepadiformis]|uniref:chromaffin granule amine transporter-like n=1 Tax=Clavelina lepadiformis TaxID=159417 RepID=UPI0040411300
MIWLGQNYKIPASLNVLCILFINFVLPSTMVSVFPTLLWKNHLESNPYLDNANNNVNITTEDNMSTNVTLHTPTTNSTSTWQTITIQSIEDAKKAFIATQGVKMSSIFICKMAVQFVTGLFVGPLIDRIGCKVPMFAGTVVMTLSAIGFALAKSYPALFVSVAIQGIGASCNVVGGMTMLANTVTDKNIRGHVIRLSLLSILLGSAAGLWSGSLWTLFMIKLLAFSFLPA